MSNRPFSLPRFMLSRFVSALGDQVLLFAVPLLILKATQSVAYSGLAFAIEWAPRLFLLPLSGSIADRVDVRTLYRIGDTIRAVVVFGVACLFVFEPTAGVFWPLSIMMAILSICHSIVFIGLEATLPRQMPADQMPKAQSMLQSCDQLSQVIGPALGATLGSFLGLQTVLFVAAGMFGISMFNALRMPKLVLRSGGEKARDPLLSSYGIALGVIRANPILIALMALTWIINIVYGSFLILTPAVVLQVFQLPERVFGLLQTSSAVAAILVFLGVPRLHKRLGASGLGIFASVIFFGGALIAATGTSGTGIALFALGSVSVMAADGIFNVYIRSLRAIVIPKEHFGKTTGFIIMINNFSIPLAGIFVARMAKTLSVGQMVTAASVGAITLYLIVLIVAKNLLRYRTVMPSLEFEAESPKSQITA